MLDTHARCRNYRTRLPHLVDEYSKLVEGIQKCEKDIREIQKVDGWPPEIQQEVRVGIIFQLAEQYEEASTRALAEYESAGQPYAAVWRIWSGS